MLTPEDRALLERINLEVNRRITYMTDIDQYGVREMWVMSPNSNRGDCEDYALTKYKELADNRFSKRRMKIYVVDIVSGPGEGQRHAILVVDGVWVLDNIYDTLMIYENLGYEFVYAVTPRY